MTDFVGGKDGSPPAIPITYVTPDKNVRTVFVKVREASLIEKAPEAQEMAEAIPGFCSGCKAQSEMTFPSGFDRTVLDKALQGKPVKAWCPRCERLTEFLPAHKYMPHPTIMKNQRLPR